MAIAQLSSGGRKRPCGFFVTRRFQASLRAGQQKSHQTTSGGLRGGDSRIRTGDPMLAKHVLYQLSYTPFNEKSRSGCRLSSRDWQS